MGFLNSILKQFIDVIEWVDDTTDTLVWKFPRGDNEIKMGAKLTVRESQVAIFINEGKIADVFTPGMYKLSTQNLPLLTTLRSWKYGFDSPFKADVYFISTRQFINQKWGTQNPIILRDADFGAIRLRAFGSYSFKVCTADVFLREISATNPDFIVDDINAQLRNLIVSRGMDAVAESKIPALDLSSKYDEVSTIITNKLQPEFNEMGLNLTKFLIENISFPPEVEEALDKRSEMGIVGNLGAYAQFQTANAIEKSAENSIGGNLGAAGMGLAAGAAMMGQVGNVFQPNTITPASNTNNDAGMPPPIPVAVQYFVAVDGKSTGPHSEEQLSQMVSGNTFTRSSMVWKKGMAAWSTADSISELSALFDSLPPPMPE